MASAFPKTARTSNPRESFLNVFPVIVDDLVAYLKKENMPQDAIEWFKKSLDHNTPGGKLNRGLSVVDTYAILKPSSSTTATTSSSLSDLTDEEYFKASILGWCIELLQAVFLVADDIMDQSITRRGQPCWYKMPNVGNIAINDAFMLESSIYFLLKKYFRQEKYYIDLIELFHDCTFQTELGQCIDLLTAPEDDVDLSRFSLEKHHNIVILKTAYYSFYLPVALAMRMAGVTDEKSYELAISILIPLGEYFQVQDDYLDCYGAPEVIGKIGTDILDGKCSWNVNIALQNATPEQHQLLEKHYGVKSPESESIIKSIFSSPNVDIPTRFAKYEQESYEMLMKMINGIDEESSGVKKAVFISFLQKVYKRKS